ncbi:MAG: N-succinylarginine dihydrolase [Thermodesulfobacteriota bacterium]
MAGQTFEVNFDGLVGPTHNYSGLSYGNIASMTHGLTVSNPRAALLQGLAKMKFLADLGVKQAVLPPQDRPDFDTLRRLGFSGSELQVVEKAASQAPQILASCYSASSMWAANAATVSPSADTSDRRSHFTPANLISQFHRSIEPPFTSAILKRIFPSESLFAHHDPLPRAVHFSDEGAANHTRLCASYREPGIELFVYGRTGFDRTDQGPRRFPARQTLEASQAIARLHGLDPAATTFARQNPEAIDAGVFHNDVISVGNQNVFLYHAEAFCEPESVLNELTRTFSHLCGEELILIEVPSQEVSLQEAVETYFFNSQLVSLPDGTMSLIAPAEGEENPRTRAALERIQADDNPIAQVHFVDVRQSMKNGGGPACLRLRVVLTEEELASTHQGIMFSDGLYHRLIHWGERHYRDKLHPEDLADPALIDETRKALDELTGILDLGPMYGFQRRRVSRSREGG